MKAHQVCIITTVHPPFDTRIFHKQATTLVQAGYPVTLIARHSKDETINGIKLIPLPRPKNRLHRTVALSWQAYIEARRQRASVYHLHDPELIPVGLALKVASLGRAKVIYDVHEDYPTNVLNKYWLPAVLRRPIAAGAWLNDRIAALAFDAIVPATDFIGNNFPNGKTTVVKNYAIIPASVKAQVNARPDTTPTVIYPGRLSRERAIVEIVEAMSLLGDSWQNVRLELLGSFDGRGFEQEVKKLSGFRRVCYRGLVPFEEIPARLAAADIGLAVLYPLPEHIECLPTKIFEYMSAGKPVITSNFPGLKEIVEGNNCGLTVDPLKPEEIAEAITYLLERPQLRKEMGENGRSAVREKYNWEIEGQKLIRVYRDMIPVGQKLAILP